MANTQPPAIFLLGPTASGKSDLAMKLTSHLPVELVSVDSALVYRDMNIGTAKPDAEILRQYHIIWWISETRMKSIQLLILDLKC